MAGTSGGIELKIGRRSYFYASNRHGKGVYWTIHSFLSFLRHNDVPRNSHYVLWLERTSRIVFDGEDKYLEIRRVECIVRIDVNRKIIIYNRNSDTINITSSDESLNELAGSYGYSIIGY